MQEFRLESITTAPAPSVRALLTTWRIPKKWRHWLRINKAVLIDGKYRNFNEPVPTDSKVQLCLQLPDEHPYLEDNGELKVVYEDAALLVVDKPAGMKPHPNSPIERGTLMNRVAGYLAPRTPFITHRLDMATSGLTLIAKDPVTQAIMNQELGQKIAARSYTALVPRGLPQAGTISAPIGRDPADRRKRMVRPDGDAAITHYEILAETATISRVRLTLETGRTHQLRVHLAYLGFPILGDPLYSPKSDALRLMLHADTLDLIKPLSTEHLILHSPVPF